MSREPPKLPRISELKAEGASLNLSGEDLTKYVLARQAHFDAAREADLDRQRDREKEELVRERERERDAREKEKEEREKEREEHEMRMLQLRLEAGMNNADINPFGLNHSAVPKLPPYKDGDDITSYLVRFERIAELLRIPDDQYALHLCSLLSGKALAIYSALSQDTTSDYSLLKKELLLGFNKTAEGYRDDFRCARISAGDTYSQFSVRLSRLFDSWINSSDIEKEFDSLRDFIIGDQFLASCHSSLRTYLKENRATTLQQLTYLADNWASARKTQEPKEGFRNICRSHSKNTRANISKDSENSCKVRDYSKIRCHACGELGHIKPQCPQNPLSFVKRKTTNNSDQYKVNFSLQDRIEQKYYASGFVNGTPVSTIMRDTGCSCIIVSEEVLPETTDICEQVTLKDYLGRQDKFPLRKCYINCPFFSGWVKAVRAPIKLCSVIVGNVKGVFDPVHDVALIETRAKARANALKPRITHPLVVQKLDPIKIDAEQFKLLQLECPSLEAIRKLTDTDSIETSKNGSLYKYASVNGLIYRKCIKSKYPQDIDRLVLLVPEKCRKAVLQVAHESPVAGHYGHRKTELKVRRDFFWPGVTKDIRLFVQSCDRCQKISVKKSCAKAPLEPMPIITVPFSKVAIDIVGPLTPTSADGHKYIFTLIDFATGYPEAIPLKEIKSTDVAEALVQIFSRVGIPREILSDHGKQFTSQLLGELHKLLGIKPLFSSIYHPMGNGRIERVHASLKTSLRKLCADKPRDWHRYLTSVLFALREMPSDRTGFSPFELLYGRQCRGPVAVLRDLWSNNVTDVERPLFQYVLELRDKLTECCELAAKNAEISISKYKSYFDLKSQDRHLNVNDEVLVLLPDVSNKLLVSWKGPFTIVEKKSKLNYVINENGTHKLYHINLLKKYHRRAKVGCAELADFTYTEEYDSSNTILNVCVASIIDPSPCLVSDPSKIETLDYPDNNQKVTISPSLDFTQIKQINDLLLKFETVMSDKPGCTDSILHDIKVQTSTPFRAKHYPIPLNLKNVFDQEVDKLLELDVIQPSDSPYSSPPLLVKKADATHRMVVDYRLLNTVTNFDAEPPCLIEEELYKFHDSKYFTELDITRAYYQIPLTKESRKFTAFPTNRGLMEFKRMPFGLVTAVATYIKLMRTVLRDLPHVSFYFDNIFIYTIDWETHLIAINSVFERLSLHGLTARPSKCFIGFRTVNYLGFTVGEGNLCMKREKINPLLSFPEPKTKTSLRSLLGLFSFYRKFIPNSADLSSPMTDLLRTKGEKIVWNSEAESSFNKIKELMSAEPILKLPDPNKTFVLRTDASSVGLGSVIMQYHDNVPHPVAYAGRKLLPAEKNYSVIERECLSIVWAVNKFKYYLLGTEFILEVDHKPLVYMNTFKGDNARLMRWALALQAYRFSLVHIPGKENLGADLLSRP